MDGKLRREGGELVTQSRPLESVVPRQGYAKRAAVAATGLPGSVGDWMAARRSPLMEIADVRPS